MNTRRIIGIIAAAALVLLTGFIGYQLGLRSVEQTSSSNEARSVAAGFVTAITNSQVSQAYDYGSAYYKSKNTQASIQAVSDKLTTENVKISNEEFYLGRDSVAGQGFYLALVENLPPSTTTGKTTANFIVKLIFEEGVWRVDSLQVT